MVRRPFVVGCRRWRGIVANEVDEAVGFVGEDLKRECGRERS